ncbi:hypothetical protein ACFU6R_08770 [Streptomyces sp. NPDC057499]|uniref:hypothetical protein n=1 Tax=Streptomyces sp. NPDC057499 TaxID=3346150 RepID=UPI0036939372
MTTNLDIAPAPAVRPNEPCRNLPRAAYQLTSEELGLGRADQSVNLYSPEQDQGRTVQLVGSYSIAGWGIEE